VSGLQAGADDYLTKADECRHRRNGRQALALFDDLFFPIVVTDWICLKSTEPHLSGLISQKMTEGMFLSS
jgi:hypothetical protein